MIDSSPGGCATGECLPEETEPPPDVPAAEGEWSRVELSPPEASAAPPAVPAAPAASAPPPSSIAARVLASLNAGNAAPARPAPAPPTPPPAPPAQAPASPAAPSFTPPPAAASARGPGMLSRDQWRSVVDIVRNESPRHGKSLAFGRLLRAGPGEVVVAFTPEADFHRTTVGGAGRGLIEEILSRSFGTPTRLTIDHHGAANAPPSLAEEETKEREAHERSVEARVRRHPALERAMRLLGGEIEHIQIVERERPTLNAAGPGEGPDGGDPSDSDLAEDAS